MDGSLVPFNPTPTSQTRDNSNHDVFISFRGDDTRHNFTNHVYYALCKKQIRSFIDSEELSVGSDIRGALFKAIETSNIYLVIFSPDYASSRWCLLELGEILRRSKEQNKLIVSAFYKISPHEVRHQEGGFQKAFKRHKKTEKKETVQRWRDMLKEVATLKGIHIDPNRGETEQIDGIVDVILKKLNRIPAPITWFKGLVGVEPHIKNVMLKLRIDSLDVRSVGIWGMTGMGKTTIGLILCSFMKAHFNGCYFFPNVREEVKTHGEEFYWSMALSKIFEEPINTSAPLSLYNDFVRLRLLRRRRIFLVFDDVGGSVIQKTLEDHPHLFGRGTKIVMTSTDKQVLHNFRVDEVCKFDGLEYEDAMRLISLKAFKEECPPNSHRVLCHQIVGYAQGNPLALTVLGSSLHGRDKRYWDSAMEKMEKIPKPEVMDLLRVNYDGLSSEERDIFLDVALTLRMEDGYQVVEMLESSYGHVTRNILINLIDKSLVCVGEYGRLWVHDMLREMCMNIIREESTQSGYEICRRLSDVNEIKRVLRSRKGIGTVHAMYFDLSEAQGVSIDLDAITEMENLRLLRVSGRDDGVGFFEPRGGVFTFEWLKMFRRNYQVLPLLHYFGWIGCPLQSLPSTFYIKNVVKLNFTLSHFRQLWTGAPEFPNLKWINLEQSVYLTETPDFSNAKNLELINVFFCTALVKLHPSVQYLQKLKTLWLESCYNLCQVPSRFESKVLTKVSLYGCTKIRECPSFASKLGYLRLTVTDIKRIPDCTTLTFFRDIFLEKDVLRNRLPPFPTSVIQLAVRSTDIEEVPSSVRFLSKLEYLWLEDNPKLSSISSSISVMKALNALRITSCEILTSIPELPPTLEKLVIENCASLETIAPISNQSQLKVIRILNCSGLSDECRRKITEYALDRMQQRKEIIVCLPTTARTGIPEWFTAQTVGSSLTLNVPSGHDHELLIGVVDLCFIVEPMSTNCLSLTWKPHELDHHDDDHLVLPMKVEMCLDYYSQPFTSDHMILFQYLPTDVAAVRGGHCKIRFECFTSKKTDDDCETDYSVVKSCGARPIFFHSRS